MSTSTTEFLLEQAKTFAAEGRFDDAYELLLALSFEVTSESFVHLRAGWADILHRQLKARFVDLSLFPVRLTGDAELRSFQLKSREAFILGLIDGAFSLEDVIAISPVNELDTLRALARLIDLRLVGLAKGS